MFYILHARLIHIYFTTWYGDPIALIEFVENGNGTYLLVQPPLTMLIVFLISDQVSLPMFAYTLEIPNRSDRGNENVGHVLY